MRLSTERRRQQKRATRAERVRERERYDGEDGVDSNVISPMDNLSRFLCGVLLGWWCALRTCLLKFEKLCCVLFDDSWLCLCARDEKNGAILFVVLFAHARTQRVVSDRWWCAKKNSETKKSKKKRMEKSLFEFFYSTHLSHATDTQTQTHTRARE